MPPATWPPSGSSPEPAVLKSRIRSVLETDRPWAVYALGDLAPGCFEHCDWYLAPDGLPALVLLYRAFNTPVLFAMGDPAHVGAILAEIDTYPTIYISIRPEILEPVRARYTVPRETAMWRMLLNPGAIQLLPSEAAKRLSPADLPDLQRLYADGDATGEAPDFFDVSMLERGVFFGVREGDELIAAAGTHLVAPGEGVAAVGNVYTRRDRRGRGLAAQATSAVTAELLRLKIGTIALNVSQRNVAAIRVYQRLGYTRYCAFYEGLGRIR